MSWQVGGGPLEEQRAGRSHERLATLVEIAKQLTRQLELPVLLTCVAEAAASVFEGEAGFRLVEGEYLVRAGATPGAQQAMLSERLRVGESMSGMVAASGEPIVSANRSTDPRIMPAHRVIVDEQRIGSGMVVPIRLEARILGTLHIFRERGYVFSQDELELAASLADLMAIAIENAQLYTRLDRRVERLQTLTQLNRLISSTLDMDQVLQKIAEDAARLMDAAVVSFWLADETARLLTLHDFSSPAHGADFPVRSVAYGQAALGWVAEQRKPLNIPDIFGAGAMMVAHDWWVAHGLRSLLVVPIVRSEMLIGVLALYGAEPFRFDQEEQELLDGLLAQADVALRNATLFAEVRQSEERLRGVNRGLEQLNQAKSEFVSMVSHEFRTPLTSIQGFSEMLRDETFSTAEVQEFGGYIHQEAERLNRMITELLDLDRMESGRMTLNLEPVELGAIVERVAEQLRATSPRHRIELELEPRLPALRGDRDKLTQVVTNLVSNAIKYSPGGGTVTISTALEDGQVHLRVRDEGLGIPTEALERVFERYSRIESGATRNIQGTGLGLPIVRQIARLHGGQAWAESELGRGSTFHVTLPLAGGGG